MPLPAMTPDLRLRHVVRCAALLSAGLLGACADDSSFTLGRDEEACVGNVPTACTLAAGCVLDEGHFLTGKFPSARRFVVRAPGGSTIRIGILLTDQRAPGTELVVTVHEPGCNDRYTWDSAGRDLFRLADANGVVVIPATVRQGGDHLVEFVSDAYCAYTLALNP